MCIKRLFSVSVIICSFLILISYIFSYKVIEENNLSLISRYDSFKSANYYGVFQIPKISINNIIYNKDDLNNNVNKNIYLVNDEDNLVVLAAHSGSSPISYFKNLNTLNINDQIILKRNGRKRIYHIFKKEGVKKTGKVKINKFNYPVIVLITCSKNIKNYQEIYYARMITSAKY